MAHHADQLQLAARQHPAVKPRRAASRDDARTLVANQLRLAVQPQLQLVDAKLLLLQIAVALLQLHVW
jgi:hypothetical protein